MINFDTKDIATLADTTHQLVQDNEYYRYIFKKTEKIVSVVFYITHNSETDSKTYIHVEELQHAAQRVHNKIIASLEARASSADEAVRGAALTLVALESKLQVAHTVGIVKRDTLDLFLSEIETVIKAMNRYTDSNKILRFDDAPKHTQQQHTSHTQTSPSPQKYRPSSRQKESEADRRTRIRTILEAKGTASIKDISDIITECSEKTIQRELNAMIKDNTVERIGERRWSQYRITS